MAAAVSAQLASGLRDLGLKLNGDQQARLLDLLELLQRWNRAFNLTAVREPERMIPHHLLDSLVLAPFVRGDNLLDVGTGAGFPGLPLAIAQPDRRFVLLDGNGKKIRFVRQAALELGLKNVEAVHARIESYPSGEKFDTIAARAFASLSDVVKLVESRLSATGRLLAAKGPKADQELRELDPPAAWVQIHRLRVPQLDKERVLVELQP